MIISFNEMKRESDHLHSNAGERGCTMFNTHINLKVTITVKNTVSNGEMCICIQVASADSAAN